MTLGEASGAFMFHDLSAYFVNGFEDLLGHYLTKKIIFSDGIMGYHGVPQMPLYVYKAEGDTISRIEDTDKLVSRYCDMGASILYRRNSIGGHMADSTNGRPDAEAWLNAVLVGAYGTHGCQIENVAVNITDTPFKRSDVPTRPGLAGLLPEGWH